MKQKLLLILMLVSFYSGVFAQGTRAIKNETIVIKEMNSFLSLSNSETSARIANGTPAVNTNHLKDLISNVHSATYFYSGEAKTYGEQPVKLYTDLGMLNRLDSSITLKQNIEIVTVQITDSSQLNSTIDLSSLSNFPNLKFVYFISSLNTTSENIASHIVNYDKRFNIFYKIDKGDNNQ
ncbi:hypothetical protein QWY90_09600 [Flavobacterium paronense]|uniref:Uncharacterized protein n=1 Tax=Flavobacterium paronense TaxID=1392775 RepID=A0ABV5GD96_9FLAO|nr:hypothetical protein [Flavobacterium paronense]MDN3677569.1 hypothetical protein [Flavobacterium paronense]